MTKNVDDAEPGVQRQRRQVADGEVARPEQRQRHHRLRGAALPGDERPEQHDAGDQRHRHARAAPAIRRLLDQREHRAAEAERRQRRADDVDVPGLALPGGNEPQQPERDQHRGDVDREDPAPRGGLHERAAAERADHRGDPGPRRPAPDRRRALVVLERVHDQRQRARDEQRAGDPLRRASADQQTGARRDRAQHRADAEADEPGGEHAPAAEHVAERAADQQQRGERQQVRLDDPLLGASPPSRLLRIAGSATLTTVESRNTIPEPRMQATSTIRFTPSGRFGSAMSAAAPHPAPSPNTEFGS